MAAEGRETPLFDTVSTGRSLSLPRAAEPGDYRSGFIHTGPTLNKSPTPPPSVSCQRHCGRHKSRTTQMSRPTATDRSELCSKENPLLTS